MMARQSLHGFIMREAAVCGRMKPKPMLKPCPFCGGEARSVYVRDGRQIVCRTCGASGPPAYHGPPDMDSAEARAIAAWNARQEGE